MKKILSSAILVVLLSSNAVYALDWNIASNLFNKAVKAQNNTQTTRCLCNPTQNGFKDPNIINKTGKRFTTYV